MFSELSRRSVLETTYQSCSLFYLKTFSFIASHQLSPRNYGSLSIPSLLSTVVEAEGQSNYAGLKSSLSGIQLVWNQFLGLIIKRFIYTKRRFLLFGILGFVPMILAILVMLLANGKTNTRVFEPR